MSKHFKQRWLPRAPGYRSPLRGPRVPRWAFLGLIGTAIASWIVGKPFGPARYAPPGDISGRATAIDGDSIRIGSNEIRLRGIDAPEGRQDCQRDGRSWPCGREAAAALTAILSQGPVNCEVDRRDQHGRSLAVCRSNGVDINAKLVADGWAVAYERGRDALYQSEENDARRARRGIWQGQFTQPRDWRQQNGIGGR